MMSNQETTEQQTPHEDTNEQTNATCTTPVYLPETMWDGKRITASFKCNEKLWKEWITHTKQFYGSVCRPMEIMIATALGITNLKVYSGLTININEQHISREQRSRRKIDAGEILPVETSLVEAVTATYERFRGSKHFPGRADVMDYVRVEWGITGLDGRAVVDNVLKRIREDRKRAREASTK